MTEYGEEFSYQSIMKRKLANVPDTLDKREGSIIFTAMAPSAKEQENAYAVMIQNQNDAYPSTASRPYLIRHCELKGITPYGALPSQIEGAFYSTMDKTTICPSIMAGMRFSIPNTLLNFKALDRLPNGNWRLECESTGAAGNVANGSLIAISVVQNLAVAEIKNVLVYGSDEESTEDLRKRYMGSLKAQSFGGNRRAYIDAVKGIGGVGQVKIIRAFNPASTVSAPGHVGVIILSKDGTVATQTLMDNVKNVLDPAPEGGGYGLAPIDHIVHVLTCKTVTLYVKLTISYASGTSWATLGPAITAAIETYIKSIRDTWESTPPELYYIRVSQITNHVLDVTGVLDASSTIGTDGITYTSNNMLLEYDSIPQLTEVRG